MAMESMLESASFHHIEIPCEDLALAERFYGEVFGAQVYMRRDEKRLPNVPAVGTIAEVEERGFRIDGTFLKIGEALRIGFLKRPCRHDRREIDHLAFAIDEDDLARLKQKFLERNIEIVLEAANHLQIRDPFGMVLELWPRFVLAGMGVL
ncbi:MAG: VOC family protein [Blastocatellia bacterium]|nr:VOC family protein [Blastocatellia bacterium]